MTQYTASYSSVPDQILSIIDNKLTLCTDYIVMQTGQYEYTAQLFNRVTKQGKQFVFSRASGSGYNYNWSMSESHIDNLSYNYTNEYYIASNLGVGSTFTPSIYGGFTAWSLGAIVSLLLLRVLFGRVLFAPLLSRR